MKILGTICSVLFPRAPEGTCCQKLLLGFFSVSCCQCFIAVSASFPYFSVLTLLSFLQAHPRPKPSTAFFLKGIICGFISGTVLYIFSLGDLHHLPCATESLYGCLQLPSPQGKGCLAMVGNPTNYMFNPTNYSGPGEKATSQFQKGGKQIKGLWDISFIYIFLLHLGGGGLLTNKELCHEVEISLQSA